ncbi:hypothetical protein ACMGWU_001142 [Campylobacter jejuni]
MAVFLKSKFKITCITIKLISNTTKIAAETLNPIVLNIIVS